MPVGENIDRLAALHRLKQSELAELAGITRQALNRILSGRKELRTLRSISEKLGVSIDALLADDARRALYESIEWLTSRLWRGSVRRSAQIVLS